MPVVSHARARQYARGALAKAFGAEGITANGVRHLAGIARLETGYGQWWRGAGVGSNNMGAIQAGSSWGGGTFEHEDSRPNDDGTSTTYVTRFRKYPAPELGWADLALVAFGGVRYSVRVAAESGDTYSVSEYLHRTRYYEGFGATPAERRWNHFRILRASIWAADRALGLPVPNVVEAVPRTVRRGDRGATVARAQRELQAAADGIFGPLTEAAARVYQQAHSLAPDGVVGPATWAVLLTDDFEVP